MSSELALYMRRRYGIDGIPSTDDLIRCLEGEGASYEGEWPLAGRLRGLVFSGHVYTQSGISDQERRAVLAHELAHVLLDEGSGLQLLAGNDSSQFGRVERRANRIAGWIIFGEGPLSSCEDVYQLAELGDVPVDFVNRWLEIVAESNWRTDSVTL